MGRFFYVGLFLLVLIDCAAAENLKDRQLIDLFSRTCLLRPAFPNELESIASRAGFTNTGPEIAPQYVNGPLMDVLYLGKLLADENISLSGHFSGEFESPTVICTVRSPRVSTSALEDLVEHSFQATDRTSKIIAEGSGRQTKWLLGSDHGEGILEVRSYTSLPRASITITYHRRNPHPGSESIQK